jgi:hypothetical protein
MCAALQLLGRADNYKDYIRRGCDKGWVETTLSGGPGRPDYVIRCEMAKTDSGYKSDWRINREWPQQGFVGLVVVTRTAGGARLA